MKDIIILEDLLNIDKTILGNSKKNRKKILIDEIIYNQCDILEVKKKLEKLFKKFKSITNYCEYISYNSLSITSKYELTIKSKNKIISNPVQRAVGRKVDEEIESTDFYKAIIELSYKLTYEECVYLINTFLDNKSEENIAKILYMSKPSLQKYKKSCIFKMWLDLEKFCD